MPDVICLGEIMLRLTVPDRQRLADARHLDLFFGGAEANAAVQLTTLGRSAGFVSRLPENHLGEACIEALRARGVDTRHVLRGGERQGLYFYEPGAGQRPASVLYDRENSATTEARPGMFDWDAIFAGAKWFHFSGITPALGEGCAALCAEACAAAKRLGLTVSFDVNFRAKLWSHGLAATTLAPLMGHVDVCITGEDEAVHVLGAEVMSDDEAARLPAIASSLVKTHGFREVAMTMRGGGATDATFRAMLFSKGQAYFSRVHEMTVVDRLGGGDSFTGALIFSLMRGDAPEQAVEFASAASAWKHTIPGDWNRATVAEIEALAAGASGGRVLR